MITDPPGSSLRVAADYPLFSTFKLFHQTQNHTFHQRRKMDVEQGAQGKWSDRAKWPGSDILPLRNAAILSLFRRWGDVQHSLWEITSY